MLTLINAVNKYITLHGRYFHILNSQWIFQNVGDDLVANIEFIIIINIPFAYVTYVIITIIHYISEKKFCKVHKIITKILNDLRFINVNELL